MFYVLPKWYVILELQFKMFAIYLELQTLKNNFHEHKYYTEIHLYKLNIVKSKNCSCTVLKIYLYRTLSVFIILIIYIHGTRYSSPHKFLMYSTIFSSIKCRYFLLLLYLLSYYVCNFVIANFSPCISMSPYCIGSFLLCATYRDFYTVMSWNSIQIIVVLQLCCLCWHFTWPLLCELSSSCIQVFINCFTFVWMQCGQFLFLFIVKCSLCLSFNISSIHHIIGDDTGGDEIIHLQWFLKGKFGETGSHAVAMWGSHWISHEWGGGNL